MQAIGAQAPATRDLSIGVVIGAVISAIFLARNIALQTNVTSELSADGTHRTCLLHGQRFFGGSHDTDDRPPQRGCRLRNGGRPRRLYLRRRPCRARDVGPRESHCRSISRRSRKPTLRRSSRTAAVPWAFHRRPCRRASQRRRDQRLQRTLARLTSGRFVERHEPEPAAGRFVPTTYDRRR